MVKISDIVRNIMSKVEKTDKVDRKEETSEEKRIKSMYDEMLKKYNNGRIYEAEMIADNILLIAKTTEVRIEGINWAWALVEKLAREFRKSRMGVF